MTSWFIGRSDSGQTVLDRRGAQRSRVANAVYVDLPGSRRRLRACNLSRRGVFIEGWDPELEIGRIVSLVFPVTVQGVIKVHRKQAVVVHVSDLGAGLHMAPAAHRPSPEPA